MTAAATARRAVAAAVAGVVLAAVSGCSDGLLFRQDRRVHIDTPARNAEVTLPVTIRWSLDRDAGDVSTIHGFAVFFDADPPPAGRDLAYLARRDDVCKRTPGCPDDEYLNSRGVYRTSETSLRVDRLRPADGPGRLRGRKQPHEVTIVALDADGRRLNEAGWSRRFVILAEDS